MKGEKMKKLLIVCVFGLMITMCACGQKSNKDTETGNNVKEDTQENEISQEETINDWKEALGVTAEAEKDTEKKTDDTVSKNDNSTTNTTTNNGNTTGSTDSNNVEDTTKTDEKEEDADVWTKDY